jgi:hypothetical protein
MRYLLLLCVLGAGLSHAQGQALPGKAPVCRGAAGALKWSVKALENQILRFTIDASLVDTCTEYRDLEFVATLLDAGGQPVATKRFALPKVSIRGPSVRTYDFQDTSTTFSGVKGVSLNGKSRRLGGLPDNRADDPLLQEVRRLTQAFAKEKQTYPEWLTFAEPDYYETYIVGSGEMNCGSGSFSQKGVQGNPSTCADAARVAAEALQRREELYGEAISESVERSQYP